jgi:SsrA-binding protein
MATRAATSTQVKSSAGGGEKLISSNRQARFEYSIIESLEVGIALTGTEIKSVRAGKVNLRDAYARINDGEVWLVGMHISPYEQAGAYFQHDPTRLRKLLLHRRQIARLQADVGQKGLTLVPLRLYLKGGRAKIELGLAKGKKLYDKRDSMAERDSRRDVERALRARD